MIKNQYKFITLAIVFLAGCFAYKWFILLDYKIEENAIIAKQLQEMETINITLEEKGNPRYGIDNLYFDLENGYEKISSNDYDDYYLNYVNNITYDSKILVGKFPAFNSFIDYEKVDTRKIFKDNNINSNQDLFNLIINNYSKEFNVFQSKKTVEVIYLSKLLGNSIIIEGKMYKLSGDLNGYLYSVGNGKIIEAHIFKNQEQYIFSFWNNKKVNYNLDFVKNFLSMIKYN